MLDAVPGDLDKREGSFVWDAIAPASIELAQLYIALERVLALAFAGDHRGAAYGLYLERRAAEHGLLRNAATKATGEVTFAGSDGAVIPAGTLVATTGGIRFVTTAATTVQGGKARAIVESVEPGDRANVPSGAVTMLPMSIPGVTGVENKAAMEGGTEAETDAALTARLLEKVRHPSTSGNVAHYLQWAKEVAGVGDARVLPLWNGPGTVKVILIDAEKRPAAASIVADTAAHIESVRPIGASVTVESAAGLAINVTAEVTLDMSVPGTTKEKVSALFEAALQQHLQDIAFRQSYVSYARMGTLLMNIPGVQDYANMTINGGTANLSLADTQVAVAGTVVLTCLTE
ncbi:baseplate j family protein [Heliobacterium gestii]|uniref:Baseplate j family protein n=2 Tax=Heliomicrobium gestii TaxID=2699 RepID=A0A845LBH0_HELGE|nr:baseplate j family protein [Heliomicrobium gestii]